MHSALVQISLVICDSVVFLLHTCIASKNGLGLCLVSICTVKLVLLESLEVFQHICTLGLWHGEERGRERKGRLGWVGGSPCHCVVSVCQLCLLCFICVASRAVWTSPRVRGTWAYWTGLWQSWHDHVTHQETSSNSESFQGGVYVWVCYFWVLNAYCFLSFKGPSTLQCESNRFQIRFEPIRINPDQSGLGRFSTSLFVLEINQFRGIIHRHRHVTNTPHP